MPIESRRRSALGSIEKLTVSLIGLVLFASIATAREPADVGPPEVYARLTVLRADLEKVRFEMGKPQPAPHVVEISNVSPREVYFQAETLFKKANRLGFEHTREVVDSIPPPNDSIVPLDVMRVVESAVGRIARVKRELKIEEESVAEKTDPSKSPTDVFYAAVAASRQLNVLLREPFSPDDVYEQLTLAVGYTARLRSRFPGNRIPETPTLQRGKTPTDVMRKLIDCFTSIERIAARSNVPMLQLKGEGEGEVTPSDVYDMATLLLSELVSMWSLADAKAPYPAYYPGRRLSSHVYQRATLLERQLLELESLVDQAPDWLTRE